MSTVKVEDFQESDYAIAKVTIDNSPELGDTSGQTMLNNFQEAISECQRAIEQGYRLTDFWSSDNSGVEFILKKKK